MIGEPLYFASVFSIEAIRDFKEEDDDATVAAADGSETMPISTLFLYCLKADLQTGRIKGET